MNAQLKEKNSNLFWTHLTRALIKFVVIILCSRCIFAIIQNITFQLHGTVSNDIGTAIIDMLMDINKFISKIYCLVDFLFLDQHFYYSPLLCIIKNIIEIAIVISISSFIMSITEYSLNLGNKVNNDIARNKANTNQ